MNQTDSDNTFSVSRERNAQGRPVLNEREAILLRLIAAVTGMIQDWDRDDVAAPLTGNTLLVADLGCQSLDIVMLMAEMSRQLNRRDIPFERLLLVHGRPISDLSLGVLADFLWEQVTNTL
jgi:acyl carrier protein